MTDLTKVTRTIPGLEVDGKPVSVTLKVTDNGPVIEFKAKRMRSGWAKGIPELLGELTGDQPEIKPIKVECAEDIGLFIRRLQAQIMIDPKFSAPERSLITEKIDGLVQDLVQEKPN